MNSNGPIVYNMMIHFRPIALVVELAFHAQPIEKEGPSSGTNEADVLSAGRHDHMGGVSRRLRRTDIASAQRPGVVGSATAGG